MYVQFWLLLCLVEQTEFWTIVSYALDGYISHLKASDRHFYNYNNRK